MMKHQKSMKTVNANRFLVKSYLNDQDKMYFCVTNYSI